MNNYSLSKKQLKEISGGQLPEGDQIEGWEERNDFVVVVAAKSSKGYQGILVTNFNAGGGWDPTSFVDPCGIQ